MLSVYFCKSTTLSVYSPAMGTVMLLLAMKALNVSLREKEEKCICKRFFY